MHQAALRHCTLQHSLQMDSLRAWPPFLEIDAATLRDVCVPLFQEKWLEPSQTLYQQGEPVADDASKCRLCLLTQGSVSRSVPESALSSLTSAASSSADERAVLLETVHARHHGLNILLGVDALLQQVYGCTVVSRCVSHVCGHALHDG